MAVTPHRILRAAALALAVAAPAAAAPLGALNPPPATPTPGPGTIVTPPAPTPAPPPVAPAPPPPTPQVAPPAARGATPRNPVFVFRGRGFGHGVGMSQYGARGAALAGWDAERILTHYYRGTRLSAAPGGAVRILLASGRPEARVSSAEEWQAVDETASPEEGFTLAAGAEYRARPTTGGGVALVDEGGATVATFPGAVRVQSAAAGGVVRLGSRPFRGGLRLAPAAGRVDVVNVVDLEQYLYGVVPREMPARWGDDAPAALQAQAVAARTYAVASAKPQSAFDMYPDQRNQVYGGVAAEDPRATAAVDATAGRVLTYNGRLITAFYFSTSGGRTESVQNVFSGGPVPYLVSVPDPFDRESPYHASWPEPVTVTGSRLARVFGLPAPITSVKVLRRGASPRVLTARLVARGGARVDVTGAKIRAVLGLRDTWFTVQRVTSATPASR